MSSVTYLVLSILLNIFLLYPKATALQNRNGMKIMIVDDHIAIRKTLRSVIDSSAPQHNEYLECEDGIVAEEQFSAFHPDVVLMDIQLQTTNGFTVAEHLLKQEPKANIIFVTSHDTQTFRKKAFELHACGFVSKEHLSELQLLLQSLSQQIGGKQ